MRIRVLAEGLLLGLGIVLGQVLGWILVAVCGLALLGEGFRWRRKRHGVTDPTKEQALALEEVDEDRFRIVDGELALAREEAAHAKALLAHTDPVTVAMIKAAWPDWRDKLAAYVSVAISRGAGARFNPVGREETVMALGEPVSANLDIGSDIELLDNLLGDLQSDDIGADQETLEEAARARRENDAAKLFSYS